jgi:hypothetical protein
VGAVALAGVATWVLRRRGKATAPTTGSTLIPDRVTPLSVVTALRLLRETRRDLDSATLKALTEEITSLERVHFGPGAAASQAALEVVLERWRGRLGG